MSNYVISGDAEAIKPLANTVFTTWKAILEARVCLQLPRSSLDRTSRLLTGFPVSPFEIYTFTIEFILIDFPIKLLKAGNSNFFVDSTSFNDGTLLHLAIINHQLEITELLLNQSKEHDLLDFTLSKNVNHF